MVQETLQINIKADNKSGIAGVQETIQSLNKLDVSANKAGAALAKSDVAVKKSSAVYQNFGRVIQDLPFGFQGIQNNLTQLIPSVGALGLAFSGIVAAITFAQVGFGAWTRGLNDAKKNADEYKKALDGIVESQAREIVELTRLTSIASNSNVAMDQRKNAVKELREQYGPYLQNLSDEKILAGDLSGAYEKITNALRAKIAVQAAEERLLPILKEQLKLQQENFELQKKVEKGKSVSTQTKDWRELGDAAQKAYFEATIGGEKSAAKIKENEKAIERLQMLVESSLSGMKNLFANSITEPVKEAKGEVKSFNDELKKLIANTVLFKGDKRLQFTLGVGGGRDNVTPRAPSEVGIKKSDLGFNDGAKDAEKYKNELQAIYDLSNQLGNSFVNTIAAGQSLGQALVQVFADIAKAIAAAIAKALIFKLITGLINPGGAGISSAFSIGDLFKGFLGIGAKPFADGGVVNKPTLGVFGEAGSEAIMPLNKLNSMLITASQLGGSNSSDMNLMTKVSGQDLLLWIQRAGFSRNIQR